MLNKFLSFIRRYSMLQPGETVICAVSGGADSIAMLFAFYLLREKLQIRLEAAHFNHHLRGSESDRDEKFVSDFCSGYKIPLHLGGGEIHAGPKGLEAAAREARYAFLRGLSGTIATAHTANDNAETVLMHMIRGTGLKGLGGITPVAPGLIRPMLGITRQDILSFLNNYALDWVEDSSNKTDQFLRNRVRHDIIPLLERENPRFSQNTSAMALRLREDERSLSEAAGLSQATVSELRLMNSAVRSRVLSAFLESVGVREPSADHILLMEHVVFSDNPSARACFPNGVTVVRCYNQLDVERIAFDIPETVLACPGITEIPSLGYKVICSEREDVGADDKNYYFSVKGQLRLRSKRSGDCIRLHGGTKSVKKLFIDRKIPAGKRSLIPLLVDDDGVLAVHGVCTAVDRQVMSGRCYEVRFEPL